MERQLRTRWSKTIDKNHVLQEYPRPLMERESYVNLNGFWEYAFTENHKCPGEFQGEILVPFSPECELSGVGRQLKPGEYLWYRRELPPEVKGGTDSRWILHFGAVDQFAVVFVNKKKVISHTGGYLPFSVDITDALTEWENQLIVQVQDTSDTSWHARGKQKLEDGGMFYPAQSGIWQTVWMEQVPADYIENLVITPDYDRGTVEVKALSRGDFPVKVYITSDMDAREDVVAEGRGRSNRRIRIPLRKFRRWTPEHPHLYGIEVSMGVDRVRSYCAMRKISAGTDRKGVPRVFLNNRPYFLNGVLDQGYWPEGLYTPPSDEAMIFDIQAMKDLGFNMLRKHIKIEPQRWYYHCDRLGMLVCQDMVNGGEAYRHWYVTYMATFLEQLQLRPKDHPRGLLSRRIVNGRREFSGEMKETVRVLYSHPSIAIWVIFNEGWGQFDANYMTDLLRREDSTRLIDQASGWFDQGGGDFRSIHNYFFILRVKPERRISVLSEYGGYAMRVENHRKYDKKYGYKFFETEEDLESGYVRLFERRILPAMKKGLSGLVYTQLSDVEEEINGIYTYDREICKISPRTIRKINKTLHETFLATVSFL